MAGDDMIAKYLASRGASGSAENANRVRQFYASNPDLLDRRASGLPGGLDDNSSVLDAMLDKHVAESMPSTPQGSVEVGQPTKASDSVPPPSRVKPAVKGPGETGGSAKNVAPSYDKRGTQYGAGTEGTPDNNEYVSVRGNANNPHASSMGGDIGNWLLALLGGGAALGGAKFAAGRGAGPVASGGGNLPGMVPNAPGGIPMDSVPVGAGPNAPAPYATDTPVTEGKPRGGPAVPVTETDPDAAAKRALIEQQVQEENDAMARKMLDQERIRRGQAGAQDTVNAAKRLFRR